MRDGDEDEDDDEEEEMPLSRKAKRRALSMSRSRSMAPPRPMSLAAISKANARATSITGVTATKYAELLQRRQYAHLPHRGHSVDSDRRIPNMKPKHLYSGKRKNGTHDRR